MRKIYLLIVLTISMVNSGYAGSTGLFAEADSIAPDTSGMRELTPAELAQELTPGWNVGNSLEATGGETAWGNPLISQLLMDSIKAAGFKSVRIPVAWSKFSDADTYTIDTLWMQRVEEVVNYVLNAGMYAIINNHWDGGWMQPTYADSAEVNAHLAAIWHQIAVTFRDYSDSLLFAGSNEVMVEGDYGAPTVEYYTVQNGYNQTFVNTVRSTGGRNYYRFLVVQGFNTNINYTVDFFEAPADVTENKLLVEVHYYDPYNFTINGDNNTIIQWGMYATRPARTETWANESYADAQFMKMKTNFVDSGYAVVLGEFAAMARTDLGTELNAEHAWYRLYYHHYITKSIVAHGLIPYYWDSGFTVNHASGIFNRSTGARAWPEIVNALTDTAYVMPPMPVGIEAAQGGTLKVFPNPAGDALHLQWGDFNPGNILGIHNQSGVTLKTITMGKSETLVDISDLPAGIYIISDRNNEISRFVKE